MLHAPDDPDKAAAKPTKPKHLPRILVVDDESVIADTIVQIYGLVAAQICGGDPQALTRAVPPPPRPRKRVAAPAE